MGITKRLGAFFTTRLPASGAGQPKPDVAPPAPEHAPPQAFDASALLDAWKARESAFNHPPDSPAPDTSPFPQSPDAPAPGASAPSPAAPDPKRLAVFALLLVVIAGATGLGGWLLLNPESSGRPGRQRPDAARSEPAELASATFVMCPSEPAVPVAGDKDGRLPLQADVAGLAAMDGASFVILSNEAAAAGRARDAEVGLLMSCRIADKFKGAASVESADAKYRLGRHYANLSLQEGSAAAPDRAQWLARAQTLLADSLLTYSTRFGDSDDRSRLAASALVSVRQTLAQKAQPQATSPAPPASPGGDGFAGAAKAPASPSPAIQAREKTRPIPPAIKACPPAVETLGLCDSPS